MLCTNRFTAQPGSETTINKTFLHGTGIRPRVCADRNVNEAITKTVHLF